MRGKHHPRKQTSLTPAHGNEPLERQAWALTMKDLRELAGEGVTQVQLAERSGVPNSSICRYEQGDKIPSPRTLEKLARGAGVPLLVVLDILLPAHRSAVAARLHGQGSDLTALADTVVDSLARVLRPQVLELVETLRRHAARPPWSAEVLPSEADRQDASALWAVLWASAPEERKLLFEEAWEFRSWAVCEVGCAESLKVAPHSPKLALGMAELAVEVAERMPGDKMFQQRLRGYAGCHLGNAHKAGSQPRKAEAVFAQALPLFKAGAVADPGLLNEARVFGLEASLRIDQRLPAQALDLLNRGLVVDRHGEAKYLLINRAQALELLGDYKGAVTSLRQAAPLVAHDPDRRLQLVVEFSLLATLCHLKQFAEAEPLLDQVRALAVEQGNDMDELRTRWLTGWVRAGLGRKAEAMALLEQVRDEFSALAMPYDTALATMELAVLYQEEGRSAEVKELAVRLAWVFHAEGVEREALAALRLFCEAAREESLTVALARQIADFLYRAQHDPELKFDARG